VSDWAEGDEARARGDRRRCTGLVVVGGTASASDPVSVTGIAPHQLAAGADAHLHDHRRGVPARCGDRGERRRLLVAHTKVTSATQLTTSLHAASGAALGARSVTITVSVTAARSRAPSWSPARRPWCRSCRPGRAIGPRAAPHAHRDALRARDAGASWRRAHPARPVSSATTATLVASFPTRRRSGLRRDGHQPDGGVAHDVRRAHRRRGAAITSDVGDDAQPGRDDHRDDHGLGLPAGRDGVDWPGHHGDRDGVSPNPRRGDPPSECEDHRRTPNDHGHEHRRRHRGAPTRPSSSTTRPSSPSGRGRRCGRVAHVAWSSGLSRRLPTLSFSWRRRHRWRAWRAQRQGRAVGAPDDRERCVADLADDDPHRGRTDLGRPPSAQVRLPPTITRFPSLKQEATFTI